MNAGERSIRGTIGLRLMTFEYKYGMPCDDFQEKWLSNKLPDREDYREWIALLEILRYLNSPGRPTPPPTDSERQAP